MRKLALLFAAAALVALASLAALAGGAAADPVDQAPVADALDGDYAADFVSPADNWLAPYCRYHNEAVFYSLSWGRLAQFLAADAGPCTDYYISVPPRDVDKTLPRPGEAAKIHLLGPRFHAMAEFATAAWAKWIAAVPGRTWASAAQEFRARMQAAGYDVAAGDTWSVNEVSAGVRAGTGTARADMADLATALAAGGVPGTVFVVAPDQRWTDLTAYKAELESWLADDGFWAALDGSVRFFAQETYTDARSWGVPGSSRNERASAISDYTEHLALLAEASPVAAEAAQFLRRTYVPLMNAAWQAQGWPGFGWTMVDVATMQSFVSEQVYANRLFAGSHPALAPEGRIGFAYVQKSSMAPADTSAILKRLASAIHQSYEQGGGSPMGACGLPGEHVWCDGSVDGAVFNDAWQQLATW